MNAVTSELLAGAQAGDVEMMYELGLRFYKTNSEDYNPQNGLLWMTKSANRGCLKAQKALGLLYSSAQHAPFPDENAPRAFEMYYMAAEQGDAEAQFWVGRCYLYGYGTAIDTEAGKKWLSSARANGYEVEDEPEAEELAEETTDAWENVKPIDEDELPSRANSVIGEAEEIERAKRFDTAYMMSGLIFAGLGAGAGLIIGGIIDVLLAVLSSGSALYIVVLVVLFLAGAGIGFNYGYRIARQRARDRAYFHTTPFYAMHGKEYEALPKASQNAYEIYVRLSKVFRPLGVTSRAIGKAVFSATRGYIIPNMILPGRKEITQADLIVLSEKAIYVIATSGISGTISGGAMDEEWRVQNGNRIRYLKNPLFHNEHFIQALQDAMRALISGVWVHDIPIYSIVCFGPHAQIGEMTALDQDRHQIVMAGAGEEVRSLIERQDSKHTLFSQEMTMVMHAIETLLRSYPDYKADYEKQRKNGNA